ncbi:cytochrome oxidase complex assembly protein 1-domain-containing protein [Talaromyces proteolyticus]|uniref:Cytochrome oxidase complex assembly protein 1-domain-containing protein n=1 Tax=Talaromyces proteolyticus TaxID=1131652 RepID=A0AAD4PXG7_9EURO|nr:cytochrome oxidase complex assembly protein 1-domain-containing protein [Talaromyces proteolyticus]KAH8693121.1 cytochrome oxidase complex assembly protein 1-domain-containing protein [Talaromyces proteolyticus]
MNVQRQLLSWPLRSYVRAGTSRKASPFPRFQRRSLIPAPSANSGPLLDRRADRDLPKIESGFKWIPTLPIFAVLVGAAMMGIFNYQKSSSSVVSSTLYALRTSPQAREILGDEIYFAQQIPWISGEMDQLHGRINISYWVKGTKSKGKMRFKSVRPDRLSYFHTEEWSLETEDGKVVQLLAPEEDPFQTA